MGPLQHSSSGLGCLHSLLDLSFPSNSTWLLSSAAAFLSCPELVAACFSSTHCCLFYLFFPYFIAAIWNQISKNLNGDFCVLCLCCPNPSDWICVMWGDRQGCASVPWLAIAVLLDGAWGGYKLTRNDVDQPLKFA